MRAGRAISLLFGIGLLFPSCEQLDYDFPRTRAEILRPKTWIIKDLLLTTPGVNGGGSVFAILYDACERDNEYRFRSEGQLFIGEGGRKCNAADPKTVKGTWTLRDELFLDINAPGDTISLVIEELTDQNMRAYFDSPSGTGIDRYTFIFSAK